jgi:multimeric flavodoxin WrbA
MKISVINGSPKMSAGISGLIINHMEKLLNVSIDVYHAIRLIKKEESTTDELAKILDCEVLLIIFPLYVDSLPAPLINVLSKIEKISSDVSIKPQVYSIVNCGFFDAKQNATALEMIKSFSLRAKLPWGYGIGIGGGGMLSSMGDNWSKGPASAIHKALSDMAAAINAKESKQNIFVKPKFPRFLYMIAADLGMRRLAKKNGVKYIRAQPYTGGNL